MSDETTRPGLWNAIKDKNDANNAAADEARRPEREAFEHALAADAKLYGTAGWDALSASRRSLVSTWAAQQGRKTTASGDAA